MLRSVALYPRAALALGPRVVWNRGTYEFSRRSGLLRRKLESLAGWQRWELGRVAPELTPELALDHIRKGAHVLPAQSVQVWDPVRAAERAEAAIAGDILIFGRVPAHVGMPPHWLRNPLTGASVPKDAEWLRTGFFHPEAGDLKFILEASRFNFVATLARGYAATGDERYAEAFWRTLQSWREGNPPMSGPLWVCGQESSLRIIAWTFGGQAFAHASATTPQRVASLWSMVAAHAERVTLTTAYARAQRNNHLFSEAAGLMTAGACYPGIVRAAAWLREGLALFDEAASDQFEESGAYRQHSHNYHRLALTLCAWTLRVADSHGIPIHRRIRERIAVSVQALARVMDPATGAVPNYGSNDGAHLLPLASGGFDDHRPAIAFAAAATGQPRLLPPGPWDEPATWLGAASEPLEAPSPPRESGHHILRGDESWATLRAANYRTRPSQADQLHVDLWWRGKNILLDAGTYLYSKPWNNALATTAAHNTVTVDGKDQMERAGQFLWLRWAQAKVVERSDAHVVAEHNGYACFGITHRRRMTWLGSHRWRVEDELVGQGRHSIALHWLMADDTYAWEGPASLRTGGGVLLTIQSVTPLRISLVRQGHAIEGVTGEDDTVRGYRSPTYGELFPALSIVARAEAAFPVRIITDIMLPDRGVEEPDRSPSSIRA